MNFISQLAQFLGSWPGLTILVIGSWWALSTKPNRPPWPWIVLALCGFAASLSEFRSEFIPNPPPFAFPLQTMRQLGRPITFTLLLLLLVLALRTPRGWRQACYPKPLQALVLLQAVLLLKVFLEGDILFGLLAVTTYLSLIMMVVRGPSRWLQTESDFVWAMQALALTGAVFLTASLYQASVSSAPMLIVHGLFMGTTGNPQAAAILLMALVPSLLFLLLYPNQPTWQRGLWLILLLSTGYALVLTGSRMGMLATLVGLAVFFGQRSSRWLKLGLGLVIGAAMMATLVDVQVLANVIGQATPAKLTSLENTRAMVWQAQWNTFLSNPLFGAPLTGERLGFGENSWLAVAAATGIVGLAAAGYFAYQCLKFMLKLSRIGSRIPQYRLHCDTVIMGLSVLLVGSILEAYLLGLITFALLALGIYLVLGQFLIEVDRHESQRRLPPVSASALYPIWPQP